MILGLLPNAFISCAIRACVLGVAGIVILASPPVVILTVSVFIVSVVSGFLLIFSPPFRCLLPERNGTESKARRIFKLGFCYMLGVFSTSTSLRFAQ